MLKSKRTNLINHIRPSELLKFGTFLIPFLIILYSVLSIYIQTFTKTPFLPGGRSSIEYLYTADSSERFGYSFSYTIFSFMTILLNALIKNMISATKTSIIVIFIVYFISLYMLSSFFSTKWYALIVFLTAFTPMFSDTLLKGDYRLFMALTFVTIFIVSICRFTQKPSKICWMATIITLAFIPFTDPHLLLWLSIQILVTLVICAFFLGRKFILYFASAGIVYAAIALLSTMVSTSLYDSLWRSDPFIQFTLNILISAFLITSSVIGMLSLYVRRYHKLLFINISWLLTSIICAIFEPLALSLTLPILFALTPASFWFMKQLFVVRKIKDEKGDGEPQYEIEVDLGKFIAVSPLLILSILLILNIPVTIVLGDHEIVPPLRVEDIYTTSKFLSQETGQQFIVAHPSLANWLLAYSKLKVLPVIDDKTFKTADLLTTTSFRMLNRFLKVDDWEPFSAARAPLIHVYDGKNFKHLVYIDDSYSRITLVNSAGKEFIESPYKARFLSYDWKEFNEYITLTMSFRTSYLLINKTIALAKEKPTLSIEYSAKVVKKDVSVKSLTINVYSPPMDVLPELNIAEHKANMVINNQKVVIIFEGKIFNILQNRTKDQRYVICKFNPINSTLINGKVNIEVKTSIGSKEKPSYLSFFDEAKKYSVNYLIIPKEHQVFIKEALPYKIDNFILKDSFVRFIINSWGKIYQEAPAYSQVLNETVQENKRVTLYKTAGLLIEKVTQFSDNQLNVTYNVQPHKNNTQLVSSTFSLWISYTREIVSKNISLKEKNVRLFLDSGEFQISFNGNVSNIVIEPHPEYGQMRILVTFQLQHSADTIGVSVKSDKEILMQYNPTTRPNMKDNDEITILTEGGVFKPVKDLKLYTIYKIKVS